MNSWLWGVAAVAAGAVLLGARKAQAYVRGKPVDVDLEEIGDGFLLRADAAEAFRKMRAAAGLGGITFKVNSAFRSMEEQAALYEKFKDGTGHLAARPGYSNHQGGTAVDISVGSTATPTYLWLVNNAPRFGWRRTVESEPWHWEFFA